jgi:transcriptional regulator with XRE-family HTH domain
MHNDWAPEDYGDTIAEIRRTLDLSMQDVARLAGVSRTQASRWSHGKHQPAYASARQLAVAVQRRGRGDLGDRLMKSAGYGPLPEDKPAPEPELVAGDEWERSVLDDPDLDAETKRELIVASRAARDAYAARRGGRQAG